MAPLFNKITRTSEYKRIYKSSLKVNSKNFIVLYNVTPKVLLSSFGITVSGKVGIAVKRNYYKRIIRNVLREIMPFYNSLLIECVFIAKASCKANYSEIKEEITAILYKMPIR